MTGTIRRWHRFVVDWTAESPWLRCRSGSGTQWAHYERHARARTVAADRHARFRQRAEERAGQWSQHGQPRVLPRWQAALGRTFGADSPRKGQQE